jgi:hypothetical protein
MQAVPAGVDTASEISTIGQNPVGKIFPAGSLKMIFPMKNL